MNFHFLLPCGLLLAASTLHPSFCLPQMCNHHVAIARGAAASSVFMPSIMQIFLTTMANNLTISQRRLIDSYCAVVLPTAVSLLIH